MTQELLAQAKTLADRIEMEQLNIISLETFLQRIIGSCDLNLSNHGAHCNLCLTEQQAREVAAQFLEQLKKELQDSVTQFGAL